MKPEDLVGSVIFRKLLDYLELQSTLYVPVMVMVEILSVQNINMRATMLL